MPLLSSLMNSAMPPVYLKVWVLASPVFGVGLAVVGQGDLDALVEEGELTEAVGQGVVAELGDGEDGLVGEEVDLGAAARRGAHLAELADGLALGVVLLPGVAVAPDLDVELLREGVDAGDADAVEAAGDLVVGGVELAAGVEHGEDDLDGGHGHAVDGLVVDRDAAAVVDDGDGVVDVDGDVDAGGVAAEGLVDGVVDDLVDEVVQALLAGGADVHGGAQADGREALEDGDVFSGVAAFFLARVRWLPWFRGREGRFRWELRSMPWNSVRSWFACCKEAETETLLEGGKSASIQHLRRFGATLFRPLVYHAGPCFRRCGGVSGGVLGMLARRARGRLKGRSRGTSPSPWQSTQSLDNKEHKSKPKSGLGRVRRGSVLRPFYSRFYQACQAVEGG